MGAQSRHSDRFGSPARGVQHLRHGQKAGRAPSGVHLATRWACCLPKRSLPWVSSARLLLHPNQHAQGAPPLTYASLPWNPSACLLLRAGRHSQDAQAIPRPPQWHLRPHPLTQAPGYCGHALQQDVHQGGRTRRGGVPPPLRQAQRACMPCCSPVSSLSGRSGTPRMLRTQHVPGMWTCTGE